MDVDGDPEVIDRPDEDREFGVLDEQEHAELLLLLLFSVLLTMLWLVKGEDMFDMPEYLLNLTALTINGWFELIVVVLDGLSESARFNGMSKKEFGRLRPTFDGSMGSVGDGELFLLLGIGDSGMLGLVLVFEDINKLVGRRIISSV